MANGILFKATGTAVPDVGVTLSKLRKDKSLTAYDVFAYDCRHPTSWPSQANPTGSDTIVNLDGTILSTPGTGATFSGTTGITFSNGFDIANASSNRILLPASCQPATTSKGYIHIEWFLVPTMTENDAVFGWYSSSNAAYGIRASSGASRQFVVYYDSTSGTTVTLSAGNFNLPISAVDHALLMVACGRVEDGSGGYLRRARIYSQALGLQNSYSGAGTGSAVQGSGSPALGRNGAISATNKHLRFFRGRHLDVLTASGVATSAWFDAICDAEFAANSARTDWNIST